jgi:hypothetical protein
MNPNIIFQRPTAPVARRLAYIVAVTALVAGAPREAAAQLDPLLFLKRTQPNVLLVVDVANRMQRDGDNNYRDASIYNKAGNYWETTLGVSDPAVAAAAYRRVYVNLVNTDTGVLGSDKFAADTILGVGDQNPEFARFDENTRLAIARRALIEAVIQNQRAARFGLYKMRQRAPVKLGLQGNDGPVRTSAFKDPITGLDVPGDDNGKLGKWLITRTEVGGSNGSETLALPLVSPSATSNTTILNTLKLAVGQAGALTPGGRDGQNIVDAPVDNMLDDAKTAAESLITADPCRNNIVVLVVGGGEGQTTNEDVAAKASLFLNIKTNRRVPIYVVAINPPAADEDKLKLVASNSGGRYLKVTSAMMNAAVAAARNVNGKMEAPPIPEVVSLVNQAVQHAFASVTDFDTDPALAVDPALSLPYGPATEHQTTSPIVGTVNLEGARDINNLSLVNDVVKNPVTSAVIPQRSNVLITSGFAVGPPTAQSEVTYSSQPGFEGRMRAFRVFKPVADDTKPSGFRFDADGTRLWVAKVPAAASRNIYTALPDGTVIPFSSASVVDLEPYLNHSDPAALIEFIRNQPLGAIVGSTPALMDPPSLDPPPDDKYPAFSLANKNRRSIVWVGANDGMLHAIDARLGVEVWAFIPFNLLPKLKALQSGQPVGDFRYFVDSSPKVADVRVGTAWRTYLVMGEGAGGTFYQTFDVTMDDMTLDPTDNVIDNVLLYFANKDRIKLKWTFPKYSSFDTEIQTAAAPWGDISSAATAVEKTVGETWSDPAIGQIEGSTGAYAVLTGSGFFKYSLQQQGNRDTVRAGTTFYMLNAETGEVFDSKDVGDDGLAETVDNCAATIPNDCTKLKNALQADPVATGPPDSRFITKAYLGDLDGTIWRFDIGLGVTGKPVIKSLIKLYTINTGSGLASAHPIFSSMATVNVGTTQQYLFVGTGSDLLPSNGVSNPYALLVILDQGATGLKTFSLNLEKTDGAAGDEKVTTFPAVAGDIVFFTTTTYKPADTCANPDGNLYAFTFIGGPAYDTTGDGRITTADKPLVRTTTGARASAPFIADQHLVIASGGKIELFGDPKDFNNGVGQVGVRILSWREVR